MSYLDYDEDLLVEIPCEFCGQLFPLILLTDHETIHLNENYPEFEDPENNDFSNLPKADNPDCEPLITLEERAVAEPVKNFEVKQKSPVKLELVQDTNSIQPLKTSEQTTKNKASKPNLFEEVTPAESPKVTDWTTDDKAAKSNQFKKYHASVDELTMKKGEKLLVFGADMNPVEELESEKQSFKMPNNPFLDDIPKEDDVEDINNLSDDNCDESLEDFWRRARDFLKKNRGKIEY